MLGSPSAGGACQARLLPAFWRVLSSALPNGAGTDTVRRIVYFGAAGITAHLAVLAAYALVGAVVAVAAARTRPGRGPAAGRTGRVTWRPAHTDPLFILAMDRTTAVSSS